MSAAGRMSRARIILANVSRIVEVTDGELASAMRAIFAMTHNVAEGASLLFVGLARTRTRGGVALACQGGRRSERVRRRARRNTAMRIADAIRQCRLRSSNAPRMRGKRDRHWRTRHFGDCMRTHARIFRGYLADHWCSRVTSALSRRRVVTELADGRRFTLRPGMSYHVGDAAEPHRSSTQLGAKLYVID